MRIATSFLLVSGLVSGSALVAAPSAVAAPGSLTVCAKAPGESAPVSIAVGFLQEEATQAAEGTTYQVANNKCVTVVNAPAPSGAWAQANRQAKRIAVSTPTGTTSVRKTRRVDFTLGSGENVRLTFYFTPR